MRFITSCFAGTLFMACALVPVVNCSVQVPAPKSQPTIVGNGATVSQPVSSQGGTVSLQGGSITIPPGALAGNQTISIQSTTSAPPAGVTNLSPVYQFGPPGLVFNKPVTITLQYTSDGNSPVFLWTNPNSTTFGVLPSSASGSSVSAQVTHFSQGMIADGTTVSTIATGSDDAGPPNTAPEDGGPPSVVDASVPGADSSTQPPLDAGSGEGDATTGGTDSGGGPVDSGPVGDGSPCAVCSNGFCAPTCAAGSTTCSGSTSCVSTDSDSQNCGACGHACGQNQTCSGGICVQSCFDATHANGCGSVGGGPGSDGGLDCSSCGSGFVQCGNQCADTSSDPNNCGGCGTACATGQVCSSGTCGPICTGGGVCANGACGTSCPTGQQVCATVGSNATGLCTSTQSDPSNCGTCGNACGQGQECIAGTCVSSCYGRPSTNGCSASGGFGADSGLDCSACGAGFIQCGNECTDSDNDPNNCGGCGVTCTLGQMCSSGSCSPLCPTSGDVCTAGGTCASACPSGQTICVAAGSNATSACTDLSSDGQNCGACGTKCAIGEACMGGACIEQCNLPQGADAGLPAGDGGFSGGSGSGSSSSGGGCVSSGCTQCGETVDNCGNPISCPPCSGDGGSCVSTGCQLGMCGPGTVDNCGNPIHCGPCPTDGGSCVSTGCQLGMCGLSKDNCGNPIDCPCGGDGGSCVSLGCTQCGETMDNCGNPINCPPCSGDGGSCVSTGCQLGMCGLSKDNCGNPIDCPCGGDAGSCVSTGCMTCGQTVDNCGNPISCTCGDAGSGGADGGAAFGTPCTTPGGGDPACTGEYDLCELLQGKPGCTKACAYPDGGSGPQPDPTDCPTPPTNGMCTPKGFCQ